MDTLPEWNMNKCFYNEQEKAYEIYIDETLKNNIAGYGIYCKNNSKNNYYSRTEGEQTLQNSTYQAVLHVLKGAPVEAPLIFIIDRKAAIDILNNLPKTYRQKQDSLHLDILNQIEIIMKNRTEVMTKFIHCYSHTKEMSTDIEKNNQNLRKIDTLEKLYGKENAMRYIEGNHQADLLTDKIYNQNEQKAPILNKYHNKYVLKTTIKKKFSKKQALKRIPLINTRIRTTIKETIRNELITKQWKKPKYDDIKTLESQISKQSTQILRDKHPQREQSRIMMMRMIHDTLPLCGKINKLVEKEKQQNTRARATTDLYISRYDKIKNNGLCPCCNTEEETVRHLFFECEHRKIIEIREQLEHQVNKAVKLHVADVRISANFVGTQTANNKPKWDNYLGSLGLIPNYIIKDLKDQLEEKDLPKLKYIIADISKLIMEINHEIWKYRCKLLYSNRQGVT